MGRPPKKPEDKRSKSLLSKITAPEQELIHQWATQQGKTMSDFIRDTMLEKCKSLYEASTSGAQPAPQGDQHN